MSRPRLSENARPLYPYYCRVEVGFMQFFCFASRIIVVAEDVELIFCRQPSSCVGSSTHHADSLAVVGHSRSSSLILNDHAVSRSIAKENRTGA
jgi:hypothetical protein